MAPPRRREDCAARDSFRDFSPRAAGNFEADSLRLDLLRADLYRMLDELARATGLRHGLLVREFERAWRSYREGTARRS